MSRVFPRVYFLRTKSAFDPGSHALCGEGIYQNPTPKLSRLRPKNEVVFHNYMKERREENISEVYQR